MAADREWWSAKELAELGLRIKGLPRTERRIRSRAKRDGWDFREVKSPGCKGRTKEYRINSFPPALHRSILLSFHQPPLKVAQERDEVHIKEVEPNPHGNQEQSEQDHYWNRYNRSNGGCKIVAQERHSIVLSVFDLVESGLKRAAAIEQIQRDTSFAKTTIESWCRKITDLPRAVWLPALLPNYAGRCSCKDCDPGIWEIILADYLRPERPPWSDVYRRARRHAEKSSMEIPHKKTLWRRFKREIPREVEILKRYGVKELLKTRPAQRRDHTAYSAYEAVNADGHKFDLFVRFPDGEICRPVGVFWQDINSGMILAYRIGKAESAHLIRLSFGDMVKAYGLPRHAYFDNGRGFGSKWLTGGSGFRYRFKIKPEDPTGILVNFGIEVHWTEPYHGQSKPIERAFRDFATRISKHPNARGAYTGNNPSAKPENYASTAMELDDFLALVEHGVDEHNTDKDRRGAACNGRSFKEVFDEGRARSIVRKVSKSQEALWLLAAEGAKVSGNSTVCLANNFYHHASLSQYAGRKVILRFDPQNLHDAVYVYELTGVFIAKAECCHAVGFNDAEKAQEQKRQVNRFKKHTKKACEAKVNAEALEVYRNLPPIDPGTLPAPKVIEPVFKKAVGHDAGYASARDAGLEVLKSVSWRGGGL